MYRESPGHDIEVEAHFFRETASLGAQKGSKGGRGGCDDARECILSKNLIPAAAGIADERERRCASVTRDPFFLRFRHTTSTSATSPIPFASPPFLARSIRECNFRAVEESTETDGDSARPTSIQFIRWNCEPTIFELEVDSRMSPLFRAFFDSCRSIYPAVQGISNYAWTLIIPVHQNLDTFPNTEKGTLGNLFMGYEAHLQK